jgi:hypothetical protein
LRKPRSHPQQQQQQQHQHYQTDEVLSENVATFKEHIAENNEIIKSMINESNSMLQQKIAKLGEHLTEIDEKLKDIFFGCEENEGRIDEITSCLNDFSSQLSQLKSTNSTVSYDFKECKRRLIKLNERVDNLNDAKADILYIRERERVIMKVIFDELENFTRVRDIDDINDSIRLKISMIDESTQDIRENVRKSLEFMSLQVDDKLSKDELTKFKACMSSLFKNFFHDLQILLVTKISTEKSLASGVVKNVDENVNCVSCYQNAQLNSLYPSVQDAGRRFELKMSRYPMPKSSDRAKFYYAANVSGKILIGDQNEKCDCN